MVTIHRLLTEIQRAQRPYDNRSAAGFLAGTQQQKMTHGATMRGTKTKRRRKNKERKRKRKKRKKEEEEVIRHTPCALLQSGRPR